jgi:hypothetical protein
MSVSIAETISYKSHPGDSGDLVKIDDAVRAFRAFGVANADTLAAKELNAARKRLALRYHPDRSPNGDGDFKLINQAYYVLLRQTQRP